MEHNDKLIITYGDHKFNFNTLPEQSLVTMLRRGVSHLMGSEAASRVKAHFDKEDAEERTEASSAKVLAAVRAEFVAKMEAGTIGVSTRGPAIDPIETIKRRIAKGQLVTLLRNNKLAWPKKADDTVTFPGVGPLTGAQMIDRRLANPKFAPAIEAEAKKVLADQKKKAEAAAKAGGDIEDI